MGTRGVVELEQSDALVLLLREEQLSGTAVLLCPDKREFVLFHAGEIYWKTHQPIVQPTGCYYLVITLPNNVKEIG